MIITDNPVNDFLQFDNEQYMDLKKRPICCSCGQHIQEEYGYVIGNDWYCEKCLEDFKEYIDD